MDQEVIEQNISENKMRYLKAKIVQVFSLPSNKQRGVNLKDKRKVSINDIKNQELHMN